MNRRGFFSALAGMALAPIMPQSEPAATGWDLARRDRLMLFRQIAQEPWTYVRVLPATTEIEAGLPMAEKIIGDFSVKVLSTNLVD
jgi:hypothetical protein